MNIVFFGARLPLTKTLVCHEGVFSRTPYPHVTRLTSYHEHATSLDQPHKLLMTHAEKGHCLFNGQTTKPLVDESRAGKTQKNAPREWVVFDFDKVDGASAEEVIKKYLPESCQNVSYIVQRSASMFLPNATQFSGHIFMLLKTPSTELQLRQWMESINFTVPALEQSITLTDSGLALHWPLDRTAAYDSKLIYIAPPRCVGFTPAIPSRDAIVLVKKRQPCVTIAAFTAVESSAISAKINALRTSKGMLAREFATRKFEDGEVLLNGEPGVIHDIKPIGDHYIKFNLNGGDSYGYWMDLRNPEIIKNFKGEPWQATKEVDPTFYKSIVKVAPRVVARPPLDEGAEVLAFYATNMAATIKTGLYSAVNQTLRLDDGNLTSASAWMGEFGIVQKGHLPHFDLIFDPHSDIQYIPGRPVINTFRLSKYMSKKPSSNIESTLKDIPRTINKVMRSMLGDPDETVYNAFMNWFACIFKLRIKTCTAWVLSGRTGTGKGAFVRNILKPLLGSENVRVVQFGQVNSDFNAFLDQSLMVVFEEADVNAVDNQSTLMTKLRHWITDEDIEINEKKVKTYQSTNHSNFLICANAKAPVVITGDDRRFNVANRQMNKLLLNPNELQTILNGDELEEFADVLMRWPVNATLAREIVDTQARTDMHEASSTIGQVIAEAILSGDLQYFIDRMPSEAEAAGDFANRFNPIGMYKDLIDKAITCATNGTPMILEESDIYVIYRTLITDTRYFQDSKVWRGRYYKTVNLEFKRNRLPHDWEKRVYGILTNWKKPTELPTTQLEIKPKGKASITKLSSVK